MKVLIIGSGGREHALAWKISRSPKVTKVYASPGNGGISKNAERIDIKSGDIAGLLNFARLNKIGLTIVGPEAPLADGIVDRFMQAGLNIFGPAKESAFLEASKVYAKETMKRFCIPTADFEIFETADKAFDFIEKGCLSAKGHPVVIKADGLAAGKGVIIAKNKDQAVKAIEDIMLKKVFGSAGDKIVIEEHLEGEEASILVVSDGVNVVPLASSRDHKRIFDDDKGPNTGGMGAYSPAPVVSGAIHKRVMEEIIKPLINGLAAENKLYKGVLYAGIMLTKEGPKVLEFNIRFGDPETQVILPRLKTDLVDLCFASIEGNVDKIKLEWENKISVCVVLVSGGYPGEYKKGFLIAGLEDAVRGSFPDVNIFHAGTELEGHSFLTSGGRVLNVVASGDDIAQAIDKVYKAVRKIKFEGMYYRKDIGRSALERYLKREENVKI